MFRFLRKCTALLHCVSHHQDGLSGLSVMLLDVITLQKYGRRFLHRTLSYTKAYIPFDFMKTVLQKVSKVNIVTYPTLSRPQCTLYRG